MNRLAILVGLIVLLVNLVRAFPDLSRVPPPEPEIAQPGPPPLALPPVSPREGRPVPAPGANDPVSVIAEKEKVNADTVGTAFAVATPGTWLTARHVVEDCNGIALAIDGTWRQAQIMALHPTADVALLRTASGVAPLPLGPTTLLYDQDGFHVGYPKFQPGDVHSRLLGRTRVVHERREGAAENAYVWAEVERSPARDGSLGGMSGGVVLNRAGEIVGVTSAESSRRGRVTTSAPETLREMPLPPDRAGPGRTIAPDDFGQRGNEVRRASQVVRVFCSHTGQGVPRLQRGEY